MEQKTVSKGKMSQKYKMHLTRPCQLQSQSPEPSSECKFPNNSPELTIPKIQQAGVVSTCILALSSDHSQAAVLDSSLTRKIWTLISHPQRCWERQVSLVATGPSKSRKFTREETRQSGVWLASPVVWVFKQSWNLNSGPHFRYYYCFMTCDSLI